MAFGDFARGPAGVLTLMEFGRRRGVPSERVLAGTAISPFQLLDPNQELSAAQELRVTRNLLRALGHPTHLGLNVGLEFKLSVHGVWEYGLISSATGAAALSLALRFLPLTHAFTEIAYHVEGAAGVLTFEPPDLESELQCFAVARDMTAAALILRELNGPDLVLSRFLIATAVNPVGRIEPLSLFGAVVQTSSASNRLVFDRAVLDRPLPHANPVTATMCEQMCRDLLGRRRAQAGLGRLARYYMNATPETVPTSLSAFARLANTSERTLKRRLKAEGASFRTLSAEARRRTAEELLSDERLTVADIAERVGFSDLSSFSQAYKRWSGEAPSVYRKRVTARQAVPVRQQ